jgi:hypothetical protein
MVCSESSVVVLDTSAGLIIVDRFVMLVTLSGFEVTFSIFPGSSFLIN